MFSGENSQEVTSPVRPRDSSVNLVSPSPTLVSSLLAEREQDDSFVGPKEGLGVGVSQTCGDNPDIGDDLAEPSNRTSKRKAEVIEDAGQDIESSKAAKSVIAGEDLIDGAEDESGLASDDGGVEADEDETPDDMDMDQEGNESDADSSNAPDQQNSDDEGNSDDETPASKDTQQKTSRTVLGPPTPGKKSTLTPQAGKKTELLSKVAKTQERSREVSQDRRASPNDKFLSDLANMEMQEYQGLVEEATRLG
ncbi:hypothetical protein BGX31_002633 [Mortierella sp. GBA43]|nr:hypothetical protein BGX31_002633 [Mortierella sp. GBA43]